MRSEPGKAATAEGRERFKRGVELFLDGDYRAALIEFTRANEVAPNYKIKFNTGQTCLELQDYACALRAYGGYANEGAKDLPKERLKSVEREIARLRSLVGRLTVTSNKVGSRVSIDDIVVGRATAEAPTLTLVVGGRHTVTGTNAPLPVMASIVDVAGGDNAAVDLELTEGTPIPEGVVTAVRPDPDVGAPGRAGPPPADTRPRPPSRTPFWIALATTGSLAAGGAVTGILALAAQSDLDTTTGRRALLADDQQSAQSRVRTLGIVTDVVFASAVVAGIVTTVLLFTTSPSSRSTTMGLRTVSNPGYGSDEQTCTKPSNAAARAY